MRKMVRQESGSNKCKGNGDWKSWHEVDIQPRVVSDIDCFFSGYSSKLSKEELAGGNLLLSRGRNVFNTHREFTHGGTSERQIGDRWVHE